MKKDLVKLCVDTVKNRVQNYSASQADEVIRKAFFDLMGTEKPDYKDMRRHGVEVFEIMEEVLTQSIINGVDENNFFMQFAETRNVALGDSIEFTVEDNSLLVASELSGNHWDITKQKLEGGASFTVKTRAFGLAVYADFLAFLAGRVDFAGLVAKVGRAMSDRIAQEVATAFHAGASYLPSQFKGSGSYSEDTLLDIVAHVEAASGQAPVVVGTRKGLNKVIGGVNSALYSDGMKDQLNGTGVLTTVNGMNLVQIPTVHKANTFDFAYDDNKLLILPANTAPIKIVYEGDSVVKEVSDGTTNMDMTMEYKFITKFGTAVVFNNLYGEYEILA